MHDVFEKQKTAFKVNATFGFVLKNNETGELRYHYSSSNTRVLTAPFLIQNRLDLISFLNKFLLQDPLEYARLQRPNSKWVVDLVTNLTLYIYRIPDHPIGTNIVGLPNYILQNPAIISLMNDPNKHGEPYRDNLCFFRCLALHQGCHPKGMEKKTKELFQQHTPDGDFKKFQGIKLSDLGALEEIFETNIVVYEMVEIEGEEENDGDERREEISTEEDRDENEKETEKEDTNGEDVNTDSNRPKIVARLVQRSLDRYESTMYLNKYNNHFSYISNIDKYAKSFACKKCNKLWKSGWQLTRHETTCDGHGTQYRYPGGYYITPPSIFEQLQDEGLCIPEEHRYFPYRAVFDFESYLDKSVASQPSKKLSWDAKHVPISVSICSNVPDFETPKCFVSDGDSQVLVNNMMTYLLEISHRSSQLLHEKFSSTLTDLEGRIQALAPEPDTPKEQDQAKKQRKHLGCLKTRFEDYIKELPVIGFNSGKYDINVIKANIYRFLQEDEKIKFIVKRNNNHMCIKTERLKFVDIMNFLAPGFNYDTFIKAYDCQLKKGFFPYEWLDSINKLSATSLPPRDAFYSSLKNEHISEDNYGYCQQVWIQEGMSNMRDFLRWYNNLDVQPFIEALEKMNAFYKERGIDTFKDGISVPGLTMKYLFKTTPDAEFSLFDEKNKDLHDIFKSNLVGGPSIVFHRYHEAGKTQIRGEKLCQKVMGYDANALYLWAIMQDMPTGMYVRRLEETGFKKEQSTGVSQVAQEWLRWEAHTRGINIRHNGNNTEKRIGPKQLPVDGYCKETNQVFELQGCWWHGHYCQQEKGITYNDKRNKSMVELYEETQEKRKYIEDAGYELLEMWECEFQQLKRNNKDLQKFIHTIRPPLYQKTSMTHEEILQAVLEDQLFGCVECDIHVPDALKPYFEEMPPIFKNVDITREDIGPFMQEFAEENGIMSTPRRSLIGSMFGQKILICTPLLKWYLLHGLEVTHIYQTVEYLPKPCFKDFGNAVSDARRDGDADPAKAIIADTMKLIGNSSYGKTITNKAHHSNVKVCNNTEATKYINESLFRDLDEVSDDLYEVKMAKRTIKEDLPLQIGLFVYQYAKLRMLQFYFDFLDKYVDRSDFQYVEMDTDSAYIAISGDTVSDLVKPHLREQYSQERSKWFPRTDTLANTVYDKRTPGLFKVEWEGDGIIALCSKTYYCFGEKNKFSSKGISKRCNRDIINKEMFLNVLRSGKSVSGINRGFRVKDNAIFTYTQSRTGFTYFYPKRKVLDDGISTTYLDI